MPTLLAELVARCALSPSVVKMTFMAAEPFPHAAGQYALLTLDDGTAHAFSLASPFSAADPRRFDIAAALGTTAESLLELELGSVVGVTGPSGALVWKADAPALLVGTGTGISPLRAIVLEQLARRDSPLPITLLFGCRDASEELWGDEFRALARAERRFRFLPTYSQPASGHDGLVGRVQAHLPGIVRELGLGLRAYLCGHTPMVSDCTELLIASGVMPEHIHGESY